MYPNGGEVPLWCDGVSETGNSDGHSTGKRSKDADSSEHCQQETEVESAYKELKEKDGTCLDQSFGLGVLHLDYTMIMTTPP